MADRTVIRPAVMADAPWLLEECRAFDRFAGSPVSLIPADESLALAIIQQIIATCVVRVAVRVADGEEEAETMMGFIAGAIRPHAFNPTVTVLTELLWWVRPEFRGTFAGAKLFNVFEEIGQQHADLIVMTLEADSPVMPDSLRRRGYVPRETSYVLATRVETVV